MNCFRYLYLPVAVALVALAIAASAQAGQPLRRGLSDFRISQGPTSLLALPSEKGRTPVLKRGVADFGLTPKYLVPTMSSARHARPPIELAGQEGFDWGDAGVGAGFAAAIATRLAAVVILASHRRSRLKRA
jgi:hypothetical protein